MPDVLPMALWSINVKYPTAKIFRDDSMLQFDVVTLGHQCSYLDVVAN